MVDRKAYYAKYRKARREETRAATAEWRRKNPERARAATANWAKAHPGQVKASNARRYKANPERAKAATAKYQKANPAKVKADAARWRRTNTGKEIIKKHIAKRKNFGFIPLNKSFAGAAGHHIDRERVIHMPEELHTSISHSVLRNRNMEQINKLAFDFMEGNNRPNFGGQIGLR